MAEDKLQENPNALLEEWETGTDEYGQEEKEEVKNLFEEEAAKGITEAARKETSGEVPAAVSDNLMEEGPGVTMETSVAETIDGGVSSVGSSIAIFAGIVLGVIILGVLVWSGIKRKRNRMKESMKKETIAAPQNRGSYTAKVVKTAKNSPVKVASIHGIGRRDSQQDSFGLSELKEKADMEKKGILAIVADGMGGLSDGDRMSQLVVITMLKGFDEEEGALPSASLLLKLVHDANVAVTNNLGELNLGKCGSTLVAAIVKDSRLSWISVGDSHIYVYRQERLVKLNRDHNYAAQLDEMVKNGELDAVDAMNDPQRGALTSFIGKRELELVDQNEIPIILEKDDRVLLMSDGIFGTVTESEIAEIMKLPLLSACERLEDKIQEKNKDNQDNYTCVAIEVK